MQTTGSSDRVEKQGKLRRQQVESLHGSSVWAHGTNANNDRLTGCIEHACVETTCSNASKNKTRCGTNASNGRLTRCTELHLADGLYQRVENKASCGCTEHARVQMACSNAGPDELMALNFATSQLDTLNWTVATRATIRPQAPRSRIYPNKPSIS